MKTKTMRLTLVNDFHNTETALAARVTTTGDLKLSGTQVARAKAALCVEGCACSNVLGARRAGSTGIATASGAPVEIIDRLYDTPRGVGLLLRVHETSAEARARDAARMGA